MGKSVPRQSTPIDDLGIRIINNKVGVHQSKCVLTTIPSPARRSTLERASSTSAVIPRSSLPEWKDRIPLPPTQEPPPNCLDCPVPQTTQEGYLRGSCQEAIPPYRQVATCYCRCLPRCDQGASQSKTRSPFRRPSSCYQGGQGEASCCPERKEG